MATESGSLSEKSCLSFRVCSKAHERQIGQRAQSAEFIDTIRRKYRSGNKKDLVGKCAMLQRKETALWYFPLGKVQTNFFLFLFFFSGFTGSSHYVRICEDQVLIIKK